MKRVHDADVLLQGEVREEQNGHFGGQHGQRADDLTLSAVHPGLSMSIVLAAKLQVIRTDHEEINAHQTISTCKNEQRNSELCLIRKSLFKTMTIGQFPLFEL